MQTAQHETATGEAQGTRLRAIATWLIGLFLSGSSVAGVVYLCRDWIVSALV